MQLLLVSARHRSPTKPAADDFGPASGRASARRHGLSTLEAGAEPDAVPCAFPPGLTGWWGRSQPSLMAGSPSYISPGCAMPFESGHRAQCPMLMQAERRESRAERHEGRAARRAQRHEEHAQRKALRTEVNTVHATRAAIPHRDAQQPCSRATNACTPAGTCHVCTPVGMPLEGAAPVRLPCPGQVQDRTGLQSS